jgi:hypothetical protein
MAVTFLSPLSELAWLAPILALLVVYYYHAAGIAALQETTLIAPVRWGLVAFLAIAYSAGSQWGSDAYLRYAVAVLAVTPTLAQLGAKRPQNGAWQFIVLTLVGVLLLPVAKGWAFGDTQPHVHTLFRWLIAAHIVVGVVNYLPTRYAGPAVLFGSAQALVAAEYLPWPIPRVPHASLIAIVCCAASLLWTNYLARPTSFWRDFRDAYGLVWGLRVAERLNVAAKQHGWPVEFAWGGMIVKTESGTLDPEVRHRIERELRSHLRRFVSHDWIARRLNG